MLNIVISVTYIRQLPIVTLHNENRSFLDQTPIYSNLGYSSNFFTCPPDVFELTGLHCI